MIVRRLDWLARMNEALEAASKVPFDWPAWNCCHFVDAIVLAMTDVAPLGDYAGAFTDEVSAWAVLSERDGNLRAACRRIFGSCVVAPFAKRGDVVLKRGGRAIGICVGARVAFASADGNGLSFVPLTDCTHAFPLGWPAETSDG